jgi:glutathione S-transferase
MELRADEIWFPKLRQLGQFVRDPTSAEAAAARAQALEAYGEMDRALGERTWMAGVFSFADIAAYAAFLTGGFFGLRPDGLPRLAAWRDRIEARPSVRTVRDGILDYLREQQIRLPEPA